MRSLTVHSQQGFSQIEIIIVLVVMGILGTIAAPSFLNWVNTRKLDVGLAELKGTLIEGQNQAIRLSKTCTINLPTGSNSVLSSTPADCLRNGDRTLEGLQLRHSFATPSLSFNFKGRVPPSLSSEQTVVLSVANEISSPSKCLVIAPGIGLIRVGTYTGSPTTALASNCKTST
ncbi:Tfp pilus assembly protein FimT/FimU [Acaryochloris sp. IP29b_bin.137]|uniref:pilus assembly FimT family protein n=1 Tax=Acaryochloris sp. IP29b_bin.137 TaxID=2969217 RepID=UPI0026273FED|nr:prepilin-type N-terminal cleavage/methylation domain-containing protein [Acaryochloris sp. IP29b_bin.137]